MSRILEINTPLGAENTLLSALSGTESLGALPEYRLTLISKRGNLTAADLLGKNVTAGVELPGRQEMRYFNGYITQFSEAGASPATWFEGTPVAHQYELTMHPWLWFLTRRANFRIFQNKTVPQIVKAVCAEYPFAQLELKLSATYAEWEYCCQYRETDFNFVLRLLEQEGIYFSFRHENGKHTMVLFDENSRHTARDGYAEIAYDVDGTGYEEREHVKMWSASRSVQSGRYTLNDFDFKKPDVSLISTLGKPLPHDMSGFELFEFPGEYETVSEGSRYAQVRMEEMHVRHEVFMASGSVRGIEAGCKFELANHPDESFNREYLITTAGFNVINNQASSSGGGGGHFYCTFEALDLRTQFRAPRVTPRPAVQGPQTAVVVGPPGEEIHVDEHGRVKLQFQWDRYNKADDQSSCWVRVSQPWAGKGWGALFLPRVGHEVIVQFIDGDPDRPIVVGRVHNGQSIPPWSLKDQKTRSGFRTRTEKGGASNFNELSFDDKNGAEEIYLHAERNHVLRIKSNRVEEIGNESHLTVQKDVFVNLKADLHEQVTGDHNNGVDGTFSLKVGQDWQTRAALKFAVDAGREIHLKAGVNLVIEAGASISLKVGGSFISIHPGGVDIEGPLVKVNSGGSPSSGSGAAPIVAKAPQRPRGSKGGTNMKPVRPKKPEVPSPQAAALQLSWKAGVPFCEKCQAASATPVPANGNGTLNAKGVQLYRKVTGLPETVTTIDGMPSRGGYQIVAHYEVRDGKQVSNVPAFYTAYNKNAGRTDYVIGQTNLPGFMRDVAGYHVMANADHAPAYVQDSNKFAVSLANGDFSQAGQSYLSAWGDALTSPTWWLTAATSVAGGMISKEASLAALERRIPSQFFKQNGGAEASDFITVHSERHMFDPSAQSTASKTQFGKDINVKALTEDTMLYPDNAFSDIQTRITKYSKTYDFNISTPDTPTGQMRVFVNNAKPDRSSQFPYYPRNP